MSRKVLLAGAAAIVLAAAALAAAFFLPSPGTRPEFGEGELHVCLNDDGTVELTWPEALTPARYRLDIRGSGDKEHLKMDYETPVVALDGLTLPMEVRIHAVAEGKNLLGMARELTSAKGLEAKVDYMELPAPQVIGTPGPGTLSLSWKTGAEGQTLYEVFALEDGVPVHVASTGDKQISLKVGREGDLEMPSYGQPLAVDIRAGFQGDGYILCGPASNLITVERQDLLGDELNLTYQEVTPLHYALEWDETQGEYYELQEWNGEDWSLLDTLEPAESFTWELGRLVSGSRHRYQVVARDRNGTVRSSEEAEFFASISPLYATVWPIIDQPFYADAGSGSASLGKIPGGTALCVLEERDSWFQVRYKDQYGYVDSRFCMINLPEYVGDHCEYDITNSYRSIFKVHENPIAKITDQVISGFEHVQTADEQFLVPFLYPCAKKLLSAAWAAEADGYRLRIYEAFRPNQATRYLYDTTAAQLNWAALVYGEEEGENGPNAIDPVTGWTVDLADGLLTDPETNEKISREDLALRQQEAETPEETETAEDEHAESAEPPADPSQAFIQLPSEEDDESGLQLSNSDTLPTESETEMESQKEDAETEPAPEYDTYFKVMTNNGRFRLGSFLAQVTSAHNRGIALDLTLAKINSGEELEMQSAIHDLSWYSATYLNNDNAKLLEKYMTGVGLRGLTSEWWHFQDDETREAIGLSGYLTKGVSMGGWTRDDTGWRYRDEDGSYYRNTSLTIDGKSYTFDQDGYTSE